MKAGTVVKPALALLVAAGVTYAGTPELFKDSLPESLTGKTKPAIKTIGIVKGAEWTDCAKVRDKVGAAIAEKLPNPTPESVTEFIKSPENRLLLAQWVIADAELRCREEMQKRSATLSDAGTYTVTFTYTAGRFSLRIKSVQLYDGKRLVAEDRHDGSTGRTGTNNSYRLEVPAKLKDPHLFVTLDMGKNKDSRGNITITKE